jgi:transposase
VDQSPRVSSTNKEEADVNKEEDAKAQQPIKLAAYIGLDWADKEHAVTLRAAGLSKMERQKLANKAEAMTEWIAGLRTRFSGAKVGIALEQSKGPVISALMCHEFIVIYPINPSTLSNYRSAWKPSGAKDDPTDADYLEELVEMHRDKLRAWLPDNEEVRLLKMLTESRRKFVDQKTKFTNQLTAALKQYYPQALELAGDLDTVRACAFLDKWATLDELKEAGAEQITRFYQEHRYRGKDKIQERVQRALTAVPLTTDRAIVEASSTIVRVIVAQLKPLIEGIEKIDRRIDELFEKNLDKEIFISLPGAGKVLAPRLSAVIGSDRSKFESVLDLQSMSGIAPVTEASGAGMWVHRRWACNHFVKQTFHEFARCSISESVWAGAYYAHLRRKGKGHHAAVRALAYKWIRIIYRCWQNKTPYNEQKYIESLKRRGSPLAALLAAASPNSLARA